MRESVKIRKATQNDLAQAIALSKKYTWENTKNKSKGFIQKPLDETHLSNLYIAEIEGKLVGIACAVSLSGSDYKWFGISPTTQAKQIQKIAVDENYRGHGIGSKLIQYILNDYKGHAIYADIMDKPVNNQASKSLFLRNQFKHIGTKPYYHEDLAMQNDWAIYENKNQDTVK